MPAAITFWICYLRHLLHCALCLNLVTVFNQGSQPLRSVSPPRTPGWLFGESQCQCCPRLTRQPEAEQEGDPLILWAGPPGPRGQVLLGFLNLNVPVMSCSLSPMVLALGVV